MDIGSFNVFSLLNRSLVKTNFFAFDNTNLFWTVPAGVKEISFFMAASGGGGSQNAGTCGGAGSVLIVKRMPVFPGMLLGLKYYDGANWLSGLAPGGAFGAAAANGGDGKAQAFGPSQSPSEPSTTTLLICRPGQGGQNTGVSGAGGGITNAVTVGGGKAGVTAAKGLDIDGQTDWLDLLEKNVIRVPGASGASGGHRGGGSPLVAGGGSGVNGGGGGSSLFGVGGIGSGSPTNGLLGGGGAKITNGGDGFVVIFWEGKKS